MYRLVILLLAVSFFCGQSIFAQSSQSVSQASNVHRWREGCTEDKQVCGSHQLMEGFFVERLDANGISVDAVLADTGQRIVVVLVVANATQSPIDVIPSLASLEALAPKAKNLKQQNAEELARKIEKKTERDAKLSLLAAIFATRRSTTTTDSYGSYGGNVGITDNRGNSASGNYNGTYSGSSSSTTTRPDYEMRGLAVESGRARIESASSEANAIREAALKANTVKPKEFICGVVFFERDSKSKNVLLRLPIGNQILEFPFALNR